MGASKWLQRVSQLRRVPERWHTPLLIASAVVFLAGSVVAYRSLNLNWTDINLTVVAVLLVAGTPLTIVVNAAELRVLAVAGNARMSWLIACRTVVVATAANMLPLPGAAVVRTHTLVSHGVALTTALRLILAAAVTWVGVSAAVAGAAAVSLSTPTAVVLIAGGGTAVLVGVATLRSSVRITAKLVWIEFATTVLHAMRLWLVLLALGITVGVREPVVLAAAAPLAAAAGVFPSGLGLSEAFAAGIAAAIGFSAAAGFAATALMRLIGLAGTAVVAVLLGVFRGNLSALTDSDEHG